MQKERKRWQKQQRYYSRHQSRLFKNHIHELHSCMYVWMWVRMNLPSCFFMLATVYRYFYWYYCNFFNCWEPHIVIESWATWKFNKLLELLNCCYFIQVSLLDDYDLYSAFYYLPINNKSNPASRHSTEASNKQE